MQMLFTPNAARTPMFYGMKKDGRRSSRANPTITVTPLQGYPDVYELDFTNNEALMAIFKEYKKVFLKDDLTQKPIVKNLNADTSPSNELMNGLLQAAKQSPQLKGGQTWTTVLLLPEENKALISINNAKVPARTDAVELLVY